MFDIVEGSISNEVGWTFNVLTSRKKKSKMPSAYKHHKLYWIIQKYGMSLTK